MESKRSLLHFLLLFLVVGIASSSYISYKGFEPHGSIGRSLLQQRSSCSLNFESMNYTVITSQCKGPQYTAERCCPPLKQLLCPISDQINDLKTDCADAFFSYVNLHGKYPPGLFANLCKEGQQGLDCSNVAVAQPATQKSSALRGGGRSSPLMIFAGVALLMFYF